MTDDDSGRGTAGEVAITAVGAYAPRFRLSSDELADAWGRAQPSGISEKAVPGADEDAITLAVEAARRALGESDHPADAVDYLAFATTTPPLAEEDLTIRLGEMLGVPETAERDYYSSTIRAGTRALAGALDAASDVSFDAASDVALVVAADCPRGAPHDERGHAAGAGAAAFVLESGDLSGPRAPIEAAGTFASPYPGTRFRREQGENVEGLGITQYDREAFRTAAEGAVDDLGPGDRTVEAAAVQAPDGALPYRIADDIGVHTDAISAWETVSELGDTGAASTLLSLARAMDDGMNTLAVGVDPAGGADALFVTAEEPVPADLRIEGEQSVSYSEYLRLTGEITADEPEGGGAYVSLPSWRRSLPQRYRLVAGECPECGALAFPPEGACDECGVLGDYEAVTLPGTGTVEAVTQIGQGGAPPEFAPQQSRGGEFGVAVVAFDGPARAETVSAPAQVTGGYDVAVGDEVEAVVRRIYRQEGVPRYGFKVRPTAEH